MSTRREFIERIRRVIYGGQPTQDAEITVNLVNNYINDAIAIAAKANYMESIKLEGISYVNNSFYITYKNLAVTQDENFLWKIQLPHIPFGLGKNEGVSILRFKDSDGQISFNGVPLSENQVGYVESMRKPLNKILYYSEGSNLYAMSSYVLSQYTAYVTMVSGGSSTNLDSELNVPSDYFPIMQEYIIKQLLLEQSRPRDLSNDGTDLGDRE